MRAWMWIGVTLLVACRGRKSAPDMQCPPVDALVMPLEAERAELQQKFPPSSPERWIERSVIDEDAAVALEQADLPEELSSDARTAYVAFLRDSAAKAAELGERYNAIADFDKAQDALRDRIDQFSADMNEICDQGVEGGCVFSPPLPDDPEGSLESLRAYVAQAEQSHVQDERAEQIWQMLLEALRERVAAMDEETDRTGTIAELESAFEAAAEQESALRAALVVGCPADLRVEPPAEDAEVSESAPPRLPPIEGQPLDGEIPAVPTLPPADGSEHNFAQPLDPASAPGAAQRPPDPEAVVRPDGAPPPPGEVSPGEEGASGPPQLAPGGP